MQIAEALAALRHLPDEALVTISVRKGDLLAALELADGGPEVLDTQQAERVFGYTADKWRRWAAAGEIDGAYQDGAGGRWRLPRASCEAHIRGLRRRSAVSLRRPSTRRVPRGPRQKPSALAHP